MSEWYPRKINIKHDGNEEYNPGTENLIQQRGKTLKSSQTEMKTELKKSNNPRRKLKGKPYKENESSRRQNIRTRILVEYLDQIHKEHGKSKKKKTQVTYKGKPNIMKGYFSVENLNVRRA